MADELWLRLAEQARAIRAFDDNCDMADVADLLDEAAQRIHPTGELNMAYEPAQPGTYADPIGDNMAGACSLTAGVIEHPEIGKVPVVGFQFFDAGGTAVIARPTLVLTQQGWVQFRALFNQIVSAATKAAS